MTTLLEYFKDEQVTARCGLCDNLFDCTREKAAKPCPVCSGELQIEDSEYSELRDDLFNAAKRIKAIKKRDHRIALRKWFEQCLM